ncbi:MAG: alpha/beta fold hydrolase [Vicinamibacterales bacterium]
MKLHYELSGRGSTSLILIHELGGSLGSWDEVVANFNDDLRILRYDLRGAGESERASDPFTMEDQSTDLEVLIDETRLPPPYLIVGAAAGAAVAVIYAAHHPIAVKGLILCAPALSVTADRRRYLMERSELAARDGMRAIVDQTLEQSFPRLVIHDQARFQRYRERFLKTDPASYGLANRALAESTADRWASAVTCSCLLLAGTHDTLRPLDHVRVVAASFPNAQVEALDSAHIMSQQAPVELARRILRFRDEVILGGRPAEHG